MEITKYKKTISSSIINIYITFVTMKIMNSKQNYLANIMIKKKNFILILQEKGQKIQLQKLKLFNKKQMLPLWVLKLILYLDEILRKETPSFSLQRKGFYMKDFILSRIGVINVILNSIKSRIVKQFLDFISEVSHVTNILSLFLYLLQEILHLESLYFASQNEILDTVS